jgi:hypothetical protein
MESEAVNLPCKWNAHHLKSAHKLRPLLFRSERVEELVIDGLNHLAQAANQIISLR